MLASGAAAPAFQLTDTQGTVQLSAELLKNGPVLVFFFKVSCPVCQLIAPFIERLSKSRALQIFGISQDDAAPTRTFSGRFGLTFPVLLDASKARYPASNQFGISMVPSLFLIEPDSRISVAFGGFSRNDLEALGVRAGVEIFLPTEQVPLFRPG